MIKKKTGRLDRQSKNSSTQQKDLLKDFDLLAYNQCEQQQFYGEASLQKAKSMMWDNYVLDENNERYSIFCNISEFKKYGPGIYLLFKFLKWCTVLLALCSLLAGINIVLLLTDNGLVVTEHNFRSDLAKTTIANLSFEKYNAVVAIDFLMALILTCGLIYWKEKQIDYVVECSKFLILPSYSTVILTKIPNGYSQSAMSTFLQENYGTVQEIFTVKDFGEDINYYKELTDIIEQYKQERSLLKIESETRTSQNLTKLFFQFRHKYLRIKEIVSKKEDYKPVFAFISFHQLQCRENVLDDHNPFCHNYGCGLFRKHSGAAPLYKDQTLSFKQCCMEPNSIIWQNLNISRWNQFLRTLVQLILVIVIMFASVVIIFMLSVLQATIIDNSHKNVTRAQVINLSNPSITRAYCLNLSIDKFYEEHMLCSEFSQKYLELTFIISLLPLIISLLKFLLTEVMKALLNFRRFPHLIHQIQSQMMIVFLFYFFAAGLLEILLSIRIQFDGWTLSFLDLLIPLVQQIFNAIEISTNNTQIFSDFTREWYLSVSNRIVLIGLASFAISGLAKILYHWMRSVFFDIMARRQKIQKKMNYWLSGDALELQFIYAMAITILYFTFLYMGPMPITVISGCVSMFILYWSTKITFVKYCAKPMIYNHSINSIVIRLLFIGIVMHCLTTPIFFGVPQIASFEGQVHILWRILAQGFYFSIIALILVYIFLRKVIGFICYKLKDHLKSEEESSPVQRMKFSLPTKVRIMQSDGTQQPYSMHQNSQYKNILKTLYTVDHRQRGRNTFILNQKLDEFIGGHRCKSKYKLFEEMVQMVQKDSKNFKLKRALRTKASKANNPFVDKQKKLEQIYKNSKEAQGQKSKLELLSIIHQMNIAKATTKEHNLIKASSQDQRRNSDVMDFVVQRDWERQEREVELPLYSDQRLSPPSSKLTKAISFQ